MARFLSNNVVEAAEMLSMYVRTACLHVEQRVNVEYVVALIMLSDIQEATGAELLSKTTLSTAKEVCGQDKDNVFEKEFPEFLPMIEERLATPTPEAPTTTQDCKPEEVVLSLNPDEVQIYRRIILSDD